MCVRAGWRGPWDRPFFFRIDASRTLSSIVRAGGVGYGSFPFLVTNRRLCAAWKKWKELICIRPCRPCFSTFFSFADGLLDYWDAQLKTIVALPTPESVKPA